MSAIFYYCKCKIEDYYLSKSMIKFEISSFLLSFSFLSSSHFINKFLSFKKNYLSQFEIFGFF